MCPTLQCLSYQSYKLIVKRHHDHDLRAKLEQLTDVDTNASTVASGEALSGPRKDVYATDKTVLLPERVCTLATDEPATNDSDSKRLTHPCRLAYAPPNSKSKTSSCEAAAAIA